MDRTKVVISGVAWSVINNVVSILYGIVSVPILIGYFGKEEYGLIGLALSVNIYIHLLDMGMTNSNVRFFSEFLTKGNKDSVQRLFGLTHLFYLIVGVLNSLILFGVSFFVSDIFKVTPEQAVTLRNLLWILGLNATFSWISVCYDQLLRANELIDWIKKRSTFLKGLQFLILALTLLFHLSIEFYFVGYVFVVTFILPLTVLKSKRIMPGLCLTPKFDREMLHMVLPYAFSIFSFSFFQFMALNLRPLLLGNMSGPGAVAEFNIINTIAMVVTVLSGTFIQVLLPIVTKMAVTSDRNGINNVIFQGTKYANLLISGIILLLIISVKEIIIVYVGEEYISLSRWMLLLLLSLCLSHRNVMTSLVFTETRLKSVAVMGAVAMCLAIVAYFVFIPIYGVGGVVIGFLIHEVTHTLFYYCYFFPVRLHVPAKQVFISSVLPSWLVLSSIGLFVYLVFTLFSLAPLWAIVIKTIVGGALIIVLARYIIFSSNDRQFISNCIKRSLSV